MRPDPCVSVFQMCCPSFVFFSPIFLLSASPSLFSSLLSLAHISLFCSFSLQFISAGFLLVIFFHSCFFALYIYIYIYISLSLCLCLSLSPKTRQFLLPPSMQESFGLCLLSQDASVSFVMSSNPEDWPLHRWLLSCRILDQIA